MSESNARAAESDGQHHFEEKEKALMSDLHSAQDDFRAALCDSFNTPAALNVLLDVVAKTNIYFSVRGSSYNIAPVQAVALWVTRMLRMFGLGEGPAEEGVVGWGTAGDESLGGDVSQALRVAF
jgi:cysteinyl-tRNA synthetase